MRLLISFLFWISFSLFSHAQPFPQAHAHNDYEHTRPLWDALENGFTSVEADVHLQEGQLLVAHNRPERYARTLDDLYLGPLNNLLTKNNDKIYPDYPGTFYLMIDFKTEAGKTYEALLQAINHYPRLKCSASRCPVKIFISGNRPVKQIIESGYQGMALDGRPEDIGKGYPAEWMPVISDHYGNWCNWNSDVDPKPGELEKIKELAKAVHAEGKLLRLWAIPDNPRAWKVLLKAGVDLINTDKLEALHDFLKN
jgi:glycerophosphoryl diester phosphodiesterase